jgi:hypothetical protein
LLYLCSGFITTRSRLTVCETLLDDDAELLYAAALAHSAENEANTAAAIIAETAFAIIDFTFEPTVDELVMIRTFARLVRTEVFTHPFNDFYVC